MILRYHQKFNLTNGDFLQNGDLKLSAILNYFQTVATNHAEQIGLGFDDLIIRDTIWVLVNIRCDIFKKVRIGSSVEVVTSPQPKGKIGYVRDYFIYDENGELAVKGSSFWCLASYSQRKYLRPTLDYVGEHVDIKAYDEDFARLKPFEEGEPYTVKIANTHVDRNGHTNNIKYSDFIIDGLNALPEISSFEIKYISETLKDDIIKIYYKQENNLINACGKKDDKPSFVAKITLKN